MRCEHRDTQGFCARSGLLCAESTCETYGRMDEWAWTKLDRDWVHGPFNTREEAIADAKSCYGPSERVMIAVGHVRYPDPSDYVMDSIYDHLESMDDAAINDEFSFCEDPPFDIPAKDLKDAQTDLTERLKAWASRWVDGQCWVLDEVERLEVGKED